MNSSKRGRSISLPLAIMLAIGSNLPAIVAFPSQANSFEVGQPRRGFRAGIRNMKAMRFSNLNLRAPRNRTTGATRSGGESKQSITALLPPDETSLEKAGSSRKIIDASWLTASAYPAVLFNVAETYTEEAEFLLADKDNNIVYSTTFKLPEQKLANGNNKIGVVILNLADVAKAENLPELKVGENYVWTVRLCHTDCSALLHPTVSGWIQRIDPTVPLASQLATGVKTPNGNVVIADELKKEELINYASVYAENGIWYSAVSSLADLLKSSPNDAKITEAWKKLLAAGSLEAIANKPIIGSATITKVTLGHMPE